MSAEVIHGDALDVLRGMEDESVGAVVTDPPYSTGGMMRGDRTPSVKAKYQNGGTVRTYSDFSGDNRDQRSFGLWCARWLPECLRVAKPGSPIVLFTDWRQLPTITDELQIGGWVWRGVAVWDKTESARPYKGAFANQAEYMVWGTRGAFKPAEPARYLRGVFRYVVRQADKHHITGKPTPLMQDVVRITPRGGAILDPFAGSGTTGVAALKEGYDFIGVEAEEEYVDIARRRISHAEEEMAASLFPSERNERMEA